MTTRLDPGGPRPLVASTPTASRTTPQPTRPFQQVMGAGADAIVGGAEAAVRRLPGGPILAAAFRPGTSSLHSSPTAPPLSTPEGAPVAEGVDASSSAPGGENVESMLDENADRNLYYITLQERISAENRLYSAYSNVLRVRHETMKNAIGNFR